MPARPVSISLAAAVAAATAVFAGAVSEAVAGSSLKVLRSWPTTLEAVRILDQYHKSVEKAAAGELKLSQAGPEVVPPLEQLNPVSAGVFDLLFSHGAYHAGSNGLLMGVDALKLDPKKLRESGLFDYISQNYQKRHGLKLLALTATGKNGYHMVLKKLPDPETGLAGRKIRGTATYHPLIKKLGGSPVVLTLGQLYTALEKGVVDGYCWPLYGLRTFKFYEAGMDLGLTEDVQESFRLFQGRILDEYDDLCEEYDITRIDASQSLVNQQVLVRKLVEPLLEGMPRREISNVPPHIQTGFASLAAGGGL